MISALMEALELCRSIEDKLRPIGWHVALTGSTLYGKRKAANTEHYDIDLVFYPHRDKEVHDERVKQLLDELGVDSKPCLPDSEYESAVYEWHLPSGTKVNAWCVEYPVYD